MKVKLQEGKLTVAFQNEHELEQLIRKLS